jgi:hypothetical protein
MPRRTRQRYPYHCEPARLQRWKALAREARASKQETPNLGRFEVSTAPFQGLTEWRAASAQSDRTG